MNNGVDLKLCLPPFLAEYEEIGAVLEAEEPELSLLWDSAGRALCNSFIAAADERGLKAYERLLGILPEAEESASARRARVMSKWLARLPYTYKALLERIRALCGDDFNIAADFDRYAFSLTVHLREYGAFLEVKKLLREMLPANIFCSVSNSVGVLMEGEAAVYSAAALWGKHKKIRVSIN